MAKLAALGLTSVTVPAELGGLGATELQLVPLLEETGYVALPEPVVDAAVAAALLAEAAPSAARAGCRGLAAGDAVVAVGLSPESYVDHPGAADVVVLAAADELQVVEPAGLRMVAEPSIDGARRLCRVEWPPGEPVARDVDAIARAVDRAALYAVAQLLGLGRRCLDLSVAYARRHQFGRPIGSYQALKHRMADDWTALEFAPGRWRGAPRGRPRAACPMPRCTCRRPRPWRVTPRRGRRSAVQVHGAWATRSSATCSSS